MGSHTPTQSASCSSLASVHVCMVRLIAFLRHQILLTASLMVSAFAAEEHGAVRCLVGYCLLGAVVQC